MYNVIYIGNIVMLTISKNDLSPPSIPPNWPAEPTHQYLLYYNVSGHNKWVAGRNLPSVEGGFLIKCTQMEFMETN